MKLSSKARCLLEIAYFIGTDLLESALDARNTILNSAGPSSERGRNRLIRSLQEKGYLESNSDESSSWVPRITSSGTDALFDDLNPVIEWNREWDGRWRAVSFDLPQEARTERYQLSNWLSKRRFGYLQGSLWISHRAYQDWTSEIEEHAIKPHYVLFFELHQIGRTPPAEYVSSAWKFKKINEHYDEYMSMLDRTNVKDLSSNHLRSWIFNESLLWRRAFEADPFLPNQLLPAGYMGKEAWSKRKQAYNSIAVKFQSE